MGPLSPGTRAIHLPGKGASDKAEGAVPEAKGGEGLEPILVAFHAQSLARIAQGTAVVIATLLALPDAIAILPSSPDMLTWLLRLVRIWLVALILWFVGFLAILHAVRLATRGIEVNDGGVRLWRLGRLIDWERIEAVGLEPQKFFSRIFFLRPEALRLSLYVRKGKHLSPQHVPSFFYRPDEFRRLFEAITLKRFGLKPDSEAVVVFQPGALDSLRRLSGQMRWQRIVLSVIIACGLVMFLGRKASVNYLYSSGNQLFKRGDYKEARNYYSEVTRLDPAFAAAWHNLAGAEFRLGNFDRARQCWERALVMKPDLVESKVSLAYLYMQEREYDKARKQLEHALRLAPRNTAALVNMADLDMRLGHTRSALKIARMVVTEEPDNHLANCLIAQGKLRMGSAKEALKVVAGENNRPRFNETFCRLVTGDIFMALGRVNDAARLYASVMVDAPYSVDAVTALGKARLAQGRLQEADDLLFKASAMAPHNPWPDLIRADMQLQLNDRKFALKLLERAVSQKNQDTATLTAAAAIYLKLGDRKRAEMFAQKALAIEPASPEALAVMRRAVQAD